MTPPQRPHDDDLRGNLIAEFAAATGKPMVSDRPPPLQVSDSAEPFVTGVERDLVGLAISGGGIRSATFGLGVLQALSREGVLPLIDFLSTVSGGGFIGGWWTA